MRKLPASIIDVEFEEAIPTAQYNLIVRENNKNRRMKRVFAVCAASCVMLSSIAMHNEWSALKIEVARRYLALEQLEAQENDAVHQSTSPCGVDRFAREELDWTITKAIATNGSPFNAQ